MADRPHTPDSLADALDQSLPPGSAKLPPESGDPLVNAAAWMASAPRPNLPAQAKADLQARLIQHAQQQTVNRRTLRPDFRPLLRWAVVASVVLAIMAAGVPVTLASVPGDSLYPVKQAFEQIENRFATSPSAQVTLMLTHAERRLQEAQTLLNRGQLDAALITASLDQMAAAARIVRSNADLPPQMTHEVETRTLELNTTLANLFVEAGQMNGDVQSSVLPLMTAVSATRSSGALLLPQTDTPAPADTTVPADEPAQADVPATADDTSQSEAPSSDTEPTATPTLEINLVLEGPVQSIDGNTIVIYGVAVKLDENDPLLNAIKVGDHVRLLGNITADQSDSPITTAIEIELADDSVAVSGDGATTWRDSGKCDNPPPDWAPAHGWHARCDGDSQQSQQPGNSDNANRGGNNRKNAPSPANNVPSSPPGQQGTPGQSQGNNGNNGNGAGKGANKK